MFVTVVLADESNLSKDPSKEPSKVPVDDSLLQSVALQLHSQWRTLCVTLEIDDKRRNHIAGYKNYKNDYERGMAMFDDWKKKAGNAATKENLQKALKKAGIKISHFL